MILEKDTDLENIERTGAYMGKYFVLGGSVPILDEDPGSKTRSKELLNIVKKSLGAGTLKEVILATSVNPEGENTNSYLLKVLNPFKEKYQLKISLLGRGLSTGTELEYSDKDTIENALRNRA
jgi:recombinational DNA repair protein RecR